MSLELALTESTKAIRDLIAVMSGATVSTPSPAASAPAPAATKPRAKKADETKALATRYFTNTKHGTVYKIEPTEPQIVLPDSVEISEADFLAHKPAVVTGEASAASSTTATAAVAEADDNLFEEPAATKPVVDVKTLTDKLREVHKAPGGGNAALAPILAAVGAKAGVPSIPADKIAEAYDLAVAKLAELTKVAA